MNVRGSEVIEAPRAVVFAAICDPNELLGIIPGCREIEQVGDGHYRGKISLRLPGIVGTYQTVVRLVDADPPGFGELEGELGGALGSVRGRATFRLTEADGTTTIDYEGHGAISGPLARLDARFVEGLAGSLISQGLRNLRARLQNNSRSGSASETRQPTREIQA